MQTSRLERCFEESALILTEGGVGQRIEHAYALAPDADIAYAALLYDSRGRAALAEIYRSYLRIAEAYDLPILLLTNTRRAGRDRVERSRYRDRNVMHDYARFLRDLASEYRCRTFVGGMMGCKGDAYSGAEGLCAEEAAEYHAWQVGAFAGAGVDFLFAAIMPTLPEAVGMAKAMEQSALPYIISLMIQAEGTLLDGHTIHDAIAEIDARTQAHPLCYMTNCVHPLILKDALSRPENRTALVRKRFCGIQANAARLSPQALDHSSALMTSEPEALAEDFTVLHRAFPMKIYGGCCGTDDRHIRAMVETLL